MRFLSYISFFVSFTASAQGVAQIKMRALVRDQQVYLRWVPVNNETIQKAVKYGYLIEQGIANREIQTVQELNAISFSTIDTVFPMGGTDTSWAALMRADINQAFVYQCVHENGGNDLMRFNMFLKACDMNIESAKAAGLFFKHANQKKEWTVYRVSINNVNPKETYSAFVCVQPHVNMKLKPIEITGQTASDKKVEFDFNSISNYLDYAGYFIERSTDSIHFNVMNKIPLVRVVTEFDKDKEVETFTDTNVVNDQTYFYRVFGLTHFGVTGETSRTIKIAPHKGFEENVWIDTSYLFNNKEAHLSWHLNNAHDQKLVHQFSVFRKSAVKEKYELLQLLPASGKEYVDTNPFPSGYYRIAAISGRNDTTWSLPVFITLADMIPPGAPQELVAVCDSNGIVTLSWKQNAENDLLGYRLFKTNVLKDEFSEVSTEIITTTSFKDTLPLEVLDKNCFYKVMAIDQVYNVSTPSKVVKVTRPDKIAPDAPQFFNVSHNAHRILLKWYNSNSGDVASLELFRKTSGEKNYVQIKRFGRDTASVFTDSVLQQGRTYTYRLMVRDSSGNSSFSNPFSITYSTGIRKSMVPVECKVDREKRNITVSWIAPEHEEVFSYQLFKAKKGEQLRLFKTLEPESLNLVDNALYPGNTYVYRIKAILVNGAQTEISTDTEVEY